MAFSVKFRAGLGLALALVCVAMPPAAAQTRPAQGRLPADPADQRDPPPPIAPEVISRGENGRVVVRATRLRQPLRIDGRLDEAIYSQVPPVSDFIQTVPAEGQPATERTEAWITFDDNFIYVSGKCYDSAPPEEWTANELRRDTSQLRQNDTFGVMFDTFHDRRNGFNFYTNPLGGFADQWITERGQPQHRLEPGVGRANRPVRGRVDGRDGHPVQVDSLQRRARIRCGASSSGARSAGRTSGRT